MIKQIEDAYKSINNILKENYYDIILLSILDYIDEKSEESENEKIDYETVPEKKLVKIKKISHKS